MTNTVLTLICILIICILITILTDNNRRRIVNISLQIRKIYFLMDVLNDGNHMIYLNTRNLKAEELPKDNKDFCVLLQKISNDQFLKAIEFFKERINKSECQEELDFYKEKLSKLQEIGTIVGTIDENSSPEFVKIIHKELAKSLMEFNASGEDE